jgi:hypothetical protein
MTAAAGGGSPTVSTAAGSPRSAPRVGASAASPAPSFEGQQTL